MEPHLLLKRILPLKGIEVETTRSASTDLTHWATRASHLHAKWEITRRQHKLW